MWKAEAFQVTASLNTLLSKDMASLRKQQLEKVAFDVSEALYTRRCHSQNKGSHCLVGPAAHSNL